MRTDESGQLVPKLESLALSHLDLLFDVEGDLLDVLEERHHFHIGLKKLVIQSCRVHEGAYRSKLRKLVKMVKWNNVEVVGRDYGRSDDDVNTGELEDEFMDYY